MIGTIEGLLVTQKIKQPEAGQDFKAHTLHSVQQIYDGQADIVLIKDFDLSRQLKMNTNVKLKCRINHWSNSSMSGQSITLLEAL